VLDGGCRRDSITETIKLTFGMAQIFKEQQLSVGEEMLKEGVESAQQEVAEMEGLNELDAERLKEQVKEELEVGFCVHVHVHTWGASKCACVVGVREEAADVELR